MDDSERNWRQLLPLANTFREADYLSFLAARVPTDLAAQLSHDSGPELRLNKNIDIDDLLRPLSSGAFPTDNLYDIADTLSFVVVVNSIVYNDKRRSLNPYTVIYATTLYLYCFIQGHGKPDIGPFMQALATLARICVELDFETRLHVCRFLASILPALRTIDIEEPAPLSSTLVVIGIVLGGIIEQVLQLTKEAMQRENIGQKWKVDEDEHLAPSEAAIVDLKRSIAETFGPQGRLQRSFDPIVSMFDEIRRE